MGNVNLRTNMDSIEAGEYLKAFEDFLYEREEEYIDEGFNHYLFYESWGRRDFREYTCTHRDCGSFEEYRCENPKLFKQHHGDQVYCPRCGNPVTLIAMGKMRSFATLEQVRRVTICRPGPNGALLLTSGWARKKWSWNELRPTVWFNEKVRTVLLPGKRMQWSKYVDWNGYRYKSAGWYMHDFVREPFNPWMYTSDGSYLLITPERIGDTALKYCQLDDWYREECRVEIIDQQEPVRQCIKYLSRYTQYPTMEIAVKIGLIDAVTDFVVTGRKNAEFLDWSARSINGLLRLPKQDAKLFVSRRYDLSVLKAYQTAKKHGIVKSLTELDALIVAAGGLDNVPLLSGCARKAGCSLTQAVNYLKRQTRGNAQSNRRTLIMWRDYMDMAERLHYTMDRLDVIMPHDLRQRHDNAVETLRINEETIRTEEYNRRRKNLQNLYEFEFDGFSIQVPKDANEIIQEGAALCHCVGGYANRHIKGKVDILFLRNMEDPSEPYVTIEMKPRTSAADKVEMVQIHGYANDTTKGAADPKITHKVFLDIWFAWMRTGNPRDRKGKPFIDIREEKTA